MAQANKAIVESIMAALSARDVLSVMENIHPDGTWEVPFRSDFFPYGVKTKAEFGERAAAFFSTFSAFEFGLQYVIADGDDVAVKATSSGLGNNGVSYQNTYHFSFHMRDQKVFRAQEFFDPFVALEYVGKLPAEVLP